VDLAPIGNAATLLAAAKAAEPYLLKVLGAPLEQIGGLLASPFEEIRKRRAERLARIASDAAGQVRESGTEPVQIPDYLAIPLLEKATLVDDENLQKMWASLLANASHPDRSADVSQSFPAMLAGLSPRDAKFLEVFFNAAVHSIFIKMRPIQPLVIVSHSKASEERLVNIVGSSTFRWKGNEDKIATLQRLVSLGILQHDREIPLEDLPKLSKYLLNEAGMRPNKKIEVTGNQVPHPQDFYSLTIPGAAFVIACRPLNQRP
jgi:hypothetical protein